MVRVGVCLQAMRMVMRLYTAADDASDAPLSSAVKLTIVMLVCDAQPCI